MTGLLYADAVDSGVVQPGMRLGELLDVGDGPVGAITVSDLAAHRSGLPRLPAGMNPRRRTWDLWRRGANPYGDSLDELPAQARRTQVRRRRFRARHCGAGTRHPGPGPARIGAAWMTVPRKGRTLTWHNGQTGGFASWIGLERERGAGAVVPSATSRSVDRFGSQLLEWTGHA